MPPACGGFGFARNTPTFDIFYRLQVTNYGVLYILFDSPPSGSNPVDVWDLCLHVQMASPNYFVATVLATSPRQEQAEKAVLMTTTRTDSARARDSRDEKGSTFYSRRFFKPPVNQRPAPTIRKFQRWNRTTGSRICVLRVQVTALTDRYLSA